MEGFEGYRGSDALLEAATEGLSEGDGGDPIKRGHVKCFGYVYNRKDKVYAEEHWFQHPDYPEKIRIGYNEVFRMKVRYDGKTEKLILTQGRIYEVLSIERGDY